MASTSYSVDELCDLVEATARDILENEPRTYLSSADFGRRLELSRPQAGRAIQELRDDPESAFAVVDERPGNRGRKQYRIVFEEGAA